MRLNKKALALIITAMVVATGFLCFQSYSYALSFKVSFVTATADKASYSMEENVTFKLRPLTTDVEFHILGDEDSMYYTPGGVYILPVPSGLTPQAFLEELAKNPYSISYYSPSVYGLVAFEGLGQDDPPLSLTWNRTLRSQFAIDEAGTQYFKAPAGYYLLFPQFRADRFSGAGVKLKIDSGSIFYCDGVQLDGKVAYDPSQGNLTASVGVLAKGSPAPVACDLNITLEIFGGANLRTQRDRALELVPGAWDNTTFSVDAVLYQYDRVALVAVLGLPDYELAIYLSGWFDQGVWRPGYY